MTITRNILSNSALSFFIGSLIFFASCKKDQSPSYRLQGTVSEAESGQPLSDVSVLIEKQSLSGNNYNGVYVMADQEYTSGSGSYSAEWDRDNVVELRATLTKNQYITVVRDLNPNILSTESAATVNFQMHPQSFVKIVFEKNPSLSQNQQINFRFDNAIFDCNCCTNDWVSYSPAILDTSKTCQVYGDYWLKYRYELIRANQDSIVYDSIYCPRFVQSEKTIVW
ncbi:MAG: hypothetical protein R2809_05270 [Flavobacteriales bacterium]